MHIYPSCPSPVAHLPSALRPSAPPDWRASLSRADRIDVCLHMYTRLRRANPFADEQYLKRKTSFYEGTAYARAVSRTEYLEIIAEGIARAETAKRGRELSSEPSDSDAGDQKRVKVDRQKGIQRIWHAIQAIGGNEICRARELEEQVWKGRKTSDTYWQRVDMVVDKLKKKAALEQEKQPQQQQGEESETSTKVDVGHAWKERMGDAAREQMLVYVVNQMTAIFQGLHQQELKLKADAFEEHCFAAAENREMYEEVVQGGLELLRKEHGQTEQEQEEEDEEKDEDWRDTLGENGREKVVDRMMDGLKGYYEKAAWHQLRETLSVWERHMCNLADGRDAYEKGVRENVNMAETSIKQKRTLWKEHISVEEQSSS